MTLDDLLSLLSQLFFPLLGIVTIYDFVRHRDRTRRDIALMFSSLAIPVGFSLINDLNPLPRWVAVLAAMPLIAQPYLLLRLIQYFQSVPRWLRRFALGGFLFFLLCLPVFLLPAASLSQIFNLGLIAYFVIVDGYAMLAFMRGALTTSGVVRQRLRFAAAGSGMLALVLIIGLLGSAIPALQSVLTSVSLLGLVISALAFYTGFVPPGWLRRIWQFVELRDFLQTIATLPNDSSTRALTAYGKLSQTANQTVSGLVSFILNYDMYSQTWQTVCSSDQQEFDVRGVADDSAVYRAWQDKTAGWVHRSTAPAASDRQLLETFDATAFIVVPVTTSSGQALGILLVFLKNASLFPNDDLDMLRLLAQQAATFLENIQLVEQLERYSHGLEQTVEAHTAEVRKSEARFARVLETTAEGVIAIDSSNRIILFNASAEKIFGYSAEEMMGQPLDNLLPPEVVGRHRQFIHDFAEGEDIARGMGQRDRALSAKRKDGTIFPIEASISKLTEGDDVILTVFIRDITEQKLAQEALLRMNEELEQRVAERTAQLRATNRELEAFSYSVSHDLRAPLRALDGFSQALLEDYAGSFDEEGEEYLSLIRMESQRMGQLIDDLLDLSRLSRTALNRQQVNLSDMVREVTGQIQKQNPQREVEFVIEDNLWACADDHLMRIVFQNLLGNAWKYSSKQVQARIEFGRSENGDEAQYFVRDNGVGFNMDYVHKLFGAFQRLHSTSEFEGTGIGLATVQRIIHQHGGTVNAQGAVNEGATFYFTLGQDTCD